MPYHHPTIMAKFWSRVRPDEIRGCWLWSGASQKPKHYGFFHFGKLQLAHRVSWILHRGEIPRGMMVCHKCDNPPCVNPDHLFLGTARDNVRDMMSKGRAKYLFGQDQSNCSLKNEQVLAIRADGRTQRAIAAEYGITQPQVSKIKSKRLWRWLD